MRRTGLIAAAAATALVVAGAAHAQTVAEPTPDSPLEALLQAAVHDGSAQRAFETSFMQSKVYVRITQESFDALQAARNPQGRLTANTPIQLWVITSEGSTPIIPMFTSEAAYRRAYPDQPWLGVSGRDALGLVKQALPVRIGDENGHAVTWTAAEVELLKRRYPPPPQLTP